MAQQIFGRYEIKEELGRGGMATVYRAHDPSFGREVAIKVLPREYLHDTTFRARFEREARTIAALEHQAIVPVYDFGEQDGQPFLVMRYMPGGSLAECIAQGPISSDETARIIGQLAPALDDAHEHGVIHRDLKPGNILFDQKGNAYLSDFGIAKVAQETTALTGGGGIIGTPAYMSPEQGRGQLVDWRSDLYSLGVIVFQMLGGRLPYCADTPVGMIYAHVHNPIPDILEVNVALPPACADLIGWAMAKDPAERYQTAQDLAADLRAALIAQTPLPARPGGEQGRGKGATVTLSEPPYAPTMDLVEPSARTRRKSEVSTELLPGMASAGPGAEKTRLMPRRQRIPMWLWVSGMVVLGLVLGGVALSRIVSMGAPTEEPAAVVASATTTNTPAPEPTATHTPTLVPTLTAAGEQALALAQAGVTRNVDWVPYTEEINGVLMALVPAGCFEMGSNDGSGDELPVHRVCFDKSFWIDVTEVTNGQFAAFGGQAWSSSSWTGADRPREQITWTEADAFCHKRGARLPTEAEWEYAARGPDGLVYPWGNEFVGDNVVWNTSTTSKVGSKPGGKSWVGAYDLSGNVWEWVNDWFLETYYGTLADGAVNPQGPESGTYRVLRGGPWGETGTNDLRAAFRYGGDPVNRYDSYYGFRCAFSD